MSVTFHKFLRCATDLVGTILLCCPSIDNIRHAFIVFELVLVELVARFLGRRVPRFWRFEDFICYNGLDITLHLVIVGLNARIRFQIILRSYNYIFLALFNCAYVHAPILVVPIIRLLIDLFEAAVEDVFTEDIVQALRVFAREVIF